jgi:hypothetical protein
VLFAQPAWSTPAVPKGETFTFTLDAGVVCSFGVKITATSQQMERATLPNGIVIVTGAALVTITNQDSGASATYNISGPTRFDPSTGRLVLTGLNLLIGPADSGGPFLIVTSGRVSFIVNQPLDMQQLRGHVMHDVCAELA